MPRTVSPGRKNEIRQEEKRMRSSCRIFSAHVTELRIERVKQMLQDEDVSAALGFNDYFLKTFKRVTGITQKQYR